MPVIPKNEVEKIVKLVHDICLTTVKPEDADYEGVRVRFIAQLDTARIPMQMDIGFGDVVVPEPQEANLPAMLDFPPPLLVGYSMESAVAEKFEIMLKLGELNSRMKDFYDIWLLSRQFDFTGDLLKRAVKETLKNRGTNIPKEKVAFSDSFLSMKTVQ